ncbi:hypothetical protein PHAVU_004G051300 [Phaseolus vulgaris]|uniref:F-box domain-containing protein n=1 Tax=Phaseolus vulgaris TaxID=3885 RepID=V7BZY2_PHAVU|nr:hypothetical protein PHAVU_004G051300g [Phaseolus vulgaris]ESW23487.1 hypothetical protein PHAVU_004G051300g [Phaseolus vulgaris]
MHIIFGRSFGYWLLLYLSGCGEGILTSKHNDHDHYTLESQPRASFIDTKDINAQKLLRGTKITLFLKDNQLEYLQDTTIKNLISKHCQLITHPIYLWSDNNKDHWQLINIWLRNKEMYDKFMSPKLGNHLPDDLAFSILFKLPLKSLKRYGCLHKSWAILLEKSNFMELFRINFISNQHSYYEDTSLLLCLDQPDKSSLFSLSSMSFQNIEKEIWSKGHCFGYFTLGSSSINGILCLYPYESGTIYLWNPSSDEFKIIPPSPIECIPDSMDPMFEYHGFGYDCARDDYKVIRELILFPKSWEIYSLRKSFILLNGSISLISNYYETTTFSISILAEIGKKETWTKLVTLGPLPYLPRPIGIGNMKYILFRTINGKLAWLDLRTHLVEKLDVNAHGIICQLIVYKGNLFPTK